MRYEIWSGRPDGVAERPERCVESVSAHDGYSGVQCWKRRGHGKDGLYCKRHAKKHECDGSGDRT